MEGRCDGGDDDDGGGGEGRFPARLRLTRLGEMCGLEAGREREGGGGSRLRE